MLELIIFLIGSLGIVWFSHQALLKPYTHGFPRFFAFEALLGLVVINARQWIIHPFSLLQVISWVLLIVSILLVISAFTTFRTHGAIDPNQEDASRLGFEKTTRLVIQGPFQFIRHPMYASLLYAAWGVFLKQITLLSGLLVFIVSLALFLASVYEERENLRLFGEEYRAYMQRTKRFIPFVF